MRAAVIAGPGAVEIREVERPRPGAGEVLVQVEGCGLCGSNVPVWEGRPWFEYPLAPGAPGHEAWGRVVETGERVAFLSDRALADFAIAAADQLVVVPPALDGVDVPGEPLGCVMNIWRRSDIRSDHTVAVVGAGFFGAVLVQLAARAGARVIAVSRRPFSLELARQMGASDTVSLGDHTAAEVMELTGGAGCDRVIEAAGMQAPLDVAGAICRVRGRLILVGFHQDGPRRVDLQLWNWRGLDVVNAHERDPEIYVDGMRAGIDALVSKRLDVAPLLTHRLSLERAAAAFELLRTRPAGFVKALVIP